MLWIIEQKTAVGWKEISRTVDKEFAIRYAAMLSEQGFEVRVYEL